MAHQYARLSMSAWGWNSPLFNAPIVIGQQTLFGILDRKLYRHAQIAYGYI